MFTRLVSRFPRLVRGVAARMARSLPRQPTADSSRVVMGEGSYGTVHVTAWATPQSAPPYVVVGRYCSIAGDVRALVNGGHRTDWISTYPFGELFEQYAGQISGHPRHTGAVRIGHDVWIGEGALLLGGVHIGNGAVIGARAVVTRDVRPYSVVAGNPAREVSRRFSDDEIEMLQRAAWWELPRESVVRLVPYLNSRPDIGRLCEQVARERDRSAHVET